MMYLIQYFFDLIWNFNNHFQWITMQKSKTFHRLRTVRSLNKARPTSNLPVIQKKEELGIKLQEKFANFMVKTKFKRLKQKMCYFYGRHFPINYQPRYNFFEEWQRLQKKQKKNLYELIQPENTAIQIISFFVLLTNTFIVWSLSVDRFFRKEGEENQLFMLTVILGFINRVVSAGLRLYLDYIGNQYQYSRTLVSKVLAKDIIFLGYFVIECIDIFQNNPIMIIIEVFLFFHLYVQAKKYYKHLKIIQLSLKYQYQFKIMDLMINLFIIAHFLSILLFVGTFVDSQSNWIIAIRAENENYLGKYLYSLYFCFTTILTIGYGDISPKNKLQIVIVIIVQLFGVIIFGYLINEIGHTLSSIRKSEENLQKDLTVLKKIQNFYDLDNKLASQAKGYLVTNQNAVVDLTPDEETNLLMKLNEDLRNQINSQKALSIVKTSIFFLCRWSKQMQINVASKLQKALYFPNQKLVQPQSKERIYIIKRGKVDIFYVRSAQNKRQYRRLMKTIKVDESSGITQNIYGYTAVISTRPCSLEAVSSQITSSYFIQKDAFLNCVNSSEIDFEYHHEIKCKIDQSTLCEALEAPSILNIRQHYHPSRTAIIRKMKSSLAWLQNEREPFLRYARKKINKHHFKNLAKTIEDIQDKVISSSNEFIEFRHFNKNEFSDQISSKDKCNDSFDKSIEAGIRGTQNCKSQTTITKDNLKLNTVNIEMKADLMLFLVRKSFHHYFERSQQYTNFFKAGNLSEVLKKFEGQNCHFDKEKEPQLSMKLSMHKIKSNLEHRFRSV